MIKILLGGSPCTYWSIAQSKYRETQPGGLGWGLFENYLIAKEKFKPDFFLYENNVSASRTIKDEIKKCLGVGKTDARYIEINSALVSAQNRRRFYVHNCGDVGQPEDRGISLRDILESGNDLTGNDKAYALTATYNGATAWNTIERHQRNMVAKLINLDEKEKVSAKNIYAVKNSKITIKNKQYSINLPDGFYIIRKMTVKECCRLQTLPDDYCRAVSKTQAYKGLGNGWTAEVIIHILNGALKDVPRDEIIVVLSIYDGIGTGRYCLDKLGFKKIRYFAYEIDKYAIQIATSNYQDIIELGDAFQVKNLSTVFYASAFK